MISEELKAIVDKFKEQGKMYFLEETTEDKISVFEEEKGITLPSKYKEWLLFSDGGELFLPAGVQFYGIEHKPLIDVDDNSRPSILKKFMASFKVWRHLIFLSLLFIQ